MSTDLLIHVKVFDLPEIYDIWVDPQLYLDHLLEEIRPKWFKDIVHYEPGFYSFYQHRLLDLNKTVKENELLPGEFLILI